MVIICTQITLVYHRKAADFREQIDTVNREENKACMHTFLDVVVPERREWLAGLVLLQRCIYADLAIR